MIVINRRGDRMMTELADKFRARAFAERRIGKDHLSRLLWQGTDPRLIPFDHLPDTYMIKANHGSAMNYPVRGNVDRTAAIETLTKWLETDYSLGWDECHYRNIERRVLIEETLDDGHDDGPLDYRFWCFDGNVAVVQVDNKPHSINPFYDGNWKRIEGGYRLKAREVEIERPPNFEEMLSIASRLSRGIDFVRVDLYDLKNRIVFGEMTFVPMAGTAVFNPPSWESRLGELWHYDKRPLELRESFRM